jgi:Site-specific recombinases, DNA invertase Pin homologs
MDLYTIKKELSERKNIYDLPLRVTFYARVSTDREEQLNSLENQIDYFNNLIKKQPNWTYIEGYIDEGISGTSVKKRKNFLRMIEDGRKKKFDLILTKEISRFSRNTLDSIKYTQELLSNGVGVNFISDNINTFQTDSELRLTIMSSIAQEEIRKLSERIKFGKKQSISKGIVNGTNNFYGYIKENGKLKIVPKESEIVKLIFELYIKDNIGTTKLGHKLYENYSIKSSAGKPIAGAVIGRIISNPKYKGYYCAHKEETLDYVLKKRKKIKKEDWIIYKDTESCPPIINEDIWNRANEILTKRSKVYKIKEKKTDYRQYPFSSKIFCYHDGATFVRGSYKNKKAENKIYYWGCANYRKYGKEKIKGCNTSIIKKSTLLRISENIINYLLNNRNELFEELKDMLLITMKNNDIRKDIDKIKDKMNKLYFQKDELAKMRMSNEIDSKEYLKYKVELEKDIFNVSEDLKNIESNEGISNKKLNIIEMVKEIIKDEDSLLSIIESIIDKIYVEKTEDDKTRLHIKLNIANEKEYTYSLTEFLSLLNSVL